ENEISDNLRVFKEGMEQGWTRERAAESTPTGRVARRSGFEVTSVENVPESQSHLKDQGLRRWRVKAIFRRPWRSLAPVTPPAGALSAESTAGIGRSGPKARSQPKPKSLAPVTPPARAVSGELPKSPPPTSPTRGSEPGTGAATGTLPAPTSEPVTPAS